jgi:hypothetical protein
VCIEDDRARRGRRVDFAEHRRRRAGYFEQARLYAAAFQNGGYRCGILPDARAVARQVGLRKQIDELGENSALVSFAPLARRLRRGILRMSGERQTQNRDRKGAGGPYANISLTTRPATSVSR